ncbi:hypothetical protein [Pelomonas cellulosilytica]|uniref:Lipoprotein n=1 Tax=Pelomonas cellulosilytica TaxID=2906762 RepID=A0ABS8XV52_9BURK|nr:hypothetical protein [Pelomonas sp. P8]MCE4553155.1 hypothetical protein [Pelomonas sp. P8]
MFALPISRRRASPRALMLPLAGLLVLLGACRREVPPTPVPTPAEPASQVAPSTDLRGASDHPQAPPAVGAVTPNQDGGASVGGAVPPTSGDGSASAASR